MINYNISSPATDYVNKLIGLENEPVVSRLGAQYDALKMAKNAISEERKQLNSMR